MPRYYFHLRTGAGLEVSDDDGDELVDDQAAEEHAVWTIKQLIFGSSLDWEKCSFEVYNGQRYAMTVWFSAAATRPLLIDHRSPPDDQHA